VNRADNGIPVGFRTLLKGFRNLGILGVGAGVPFAASLASLSPPWPPGIVGATAIVELVTLVLLYHNLHNASRRVTTFFLSMGAVCFGIFCVAYLAGLSLMTFTIPASGERFNKGFECTQNAFLVFGRKCPWLGMDELASAEYEAERLWTLRSILVSQVGLVGTWTCAFVALATILGAFLVSHNQQPAKRSNSRGRRGTHSA
jgi:hypothetical protein